MPHQPPLHRLDDDENKLHAVAGEWAHQIWTARSQYAASQVTYVLLSQLVENLTETIDALLHDPQHASQDQQHLHQDGE